MGAGQNVLGTLVAISVAKKATLYAAGRIYGFPRIYSRIMRATRASGASAETRKAVSGSLQKTFRLPNAVYDTFFSRRWARRPNGKPRAPGPSTAAPASGSKPL